MRAGGVSQVSPSSHGAEAPPGMVLARARPACVGSLKLAGRPWKNGIRIDMRAPPLDPKGHEGGTRHETHPRPGHPSRTRAGTRDRARRRGSGDALPRVPPGSPSAAPAVAPTNTGEPRVTGTPRVGEVQRTTRGTWTGTRRSTMCTAGSAARVAVRRTRRTASGSRTRGHDVRRPGGDVGFRIRSQVRASNDEGSATATSNPTAVVQPASPAAPRT